MNISISKTVFSQPKPYTFDQFKRCEQQEYAIERIRAVRNMINTNAQAIRAGEQLPHTDAQIKEAKQQVPAYYLHVAKLKEGAETHTEKDIESVNNLMIYDIDHLGLDSEETLTKWSEFSFDDQFYKQHGICRVQVSVSGRGMRFWVQMQENETLVKCMERINQVLLQKGLDLKCLDQSCKNANRASYFSLAEDVLYEDEEMINNTVETSYSAVCERDACPCVSTSGYVRETYSHTSLQVEQPTRHGIKEKGILILLSFA